jgi:SpoVK/Ycf46/Vps4 family AAA+-type ATPase
VFVCATANDVSGLPPELLRKGRFDELFFVDLPNVTERAEILRTALRANGRGEVDISLPDVAAVTSEFTGAELAALVPDALFTAFADGEREITTADLIASAGATITLSKTAAEKIAAVRKWGKERARAASRPEVARKVVVGELDM